MAVCVCIALDMSVSGFGPSGMGCSRLEVRPDKKNKAGDRPRPTHENGLDLNFLIFFKLFLLNQLKLHLNDSEFSLGLVQKCLLSTKLLLVFNQFFYHIINTGTCIFTIDSLVVHFISHLD